MTVSAIVLRKSPSPAFNSSASGSPRSSGSPVRLKSRNSTLASQSGGRLSYTISSGNFHHDRGHYLPAGAVSVDHAGPKEYGIEDTVAAARVASLQVLATFDTETLTM